MRVLHVITGLGAGGAETQLRQLIAHSHHDADVVALYNAGWMADQLRADGVAVTDLGMRSNRELSAVLKLAGLMRQGRYEVVHTHLYRACLYGRIAARLAGIRTVVATEHSLINDRIEGRLGTRGVRLLYRLGERLGMVTIAVSDAVRANLLRWGIANSRVVTVPNGLPIASFAFSPASRASIRAHLGISHSATVIGAVGRLHSGKHFDALMAALALRLEEDRQLLIVGDGPERDRLQSLAADLGVTRHVHLVGEQLVAPYLAAMDLLVSPSRSETFGLAIIEALAAGLPVLYGACPAIEELTTPVHGAFPFSGDFSHLAFDVESVLAQSPVGRRCPEQLRSLDIAVVSARVDELYERLALRSS